MASSQVPSTATTARGSRVLDYCLDPRRFGIFLLIASGALCLWYLPYGLPTPDAGAALVHAAKILRGAVFYRDLDAYPFPAAVYLLAGAMRIFGETLTVARVVAAVTYTSILLASYRITLDLGGRGAAALCGLAILSLKFLAWPAFQDSLYAEVGLCFALWSMVAYFRFRRRGERSALVAAGLLAGVTILSKQSLGIYLALTVAGLLLSRYFRADGRTMRTIARDLITYAFAAAAPIGAAAFYFWWHGVLDRMLYSGLVRPFRGYLPTSGLPFLVPLEWWRFGELKGQAGFAYSIGPVFEMLGMQKLPLRSWYPQLWLAEELAVRALYTAIPLIFVAAAIAIVRHRRSREKQSIASLVAMSLATLGSAFPRADYYHIISIYPVMLVLAFVTGSRLLADLRRPWMKTAATVTAAVAVVGLLLTTLLTAGWYFRGMTYQADFDRGHVRIYPENAWVDDVVRYLNANVAAGDGIFVYGHEAYYYYFSDRYGSWPFVQLYPGMTGDDDGNALAQSLAAAPPALIVKGLIAGWPGLPNVDSYAGELRAFVDAHYQPTTRPFSDGLGPDASAPPAWLIQVLARKPSSK